MPSLLERIVEDTCPTCVGHGVIKGSLPVEPPEWFELVNVRCPDCEGTGYVELVVMNRG